MEQFAVRPDASVAVQVMTVVPFGSWAPARVAVALKLLINVAPGQLSEKVALNSDPKTV
jgi:hypothetical protein